jgi:GMP synthase-like glutamine amidotransferase
VIRHPDDRARVRLVVCGAPPPALAAYTEGYLPLFRSILAPHGVDLDVVDARRELVEVEPDLVDGYVLTGSASSVLDPDPWIADAAAFVREAVAARVPLAGVCFGHQLVAHALGGRVGRAPGGWNAGVHEYALAAPLAPDGRAPQRLHAMHQDQVLEPPAGATVWASSPRCPVAGLTVGDTVWTVQGHPEMTTDLVGAIIDLRAETFGPDLATAARASLATPTDHDAVAATIAALVRRVPARA